MNKIIYLTCGYPSIQETMNQLTNQTKDDFYILNIPFSDPIAEQPELQKQNVEALKNGCTVKNTFEMIKTITLNGPVALRCYANVIFAYGIETFMKACKEANIYELLIPDLPIEEFEEFTSIASIYDIEIIPTISSTTINRFKKVIPYASRYLYLASRKQDDISSALNQLKDIKLNVINEREIKYN